jgi:predicted ATP-dependent endonuclease of OLD family
MIETIEIGYIRSFFTPQTLSLARPDGKDGSGYNIIVGKNNTGKSTLFRLLRELISPHQIMTIGLEARHDPHPPSLSVKWRSGDTTQTLSFDATRTGGHFQKTGNILIAEEKLRYVPSRRPFISEYTSSIATALDYERADFNSRRVNLAHYDVALAGSLAKVISDSRMGSDLLEVLKQIDPRITALDSDNIGGRDVIRFRSASGRWHPVSDTGDGIVNSIRIVHALITSEPGSCIVVDEPELSLHPQIQKSLYDVLIEFSASHQVIVATHSPHFVSWKDISEHGSLFRCYLDQKGYSQIRTAHRGTLANVRSSAQGNITNRKYYDAVCKELFFSDDALLVEGPDDVHYIANFLDAECMQPLPLMGYGCAGNIQSWARLCFELGIRCAALYDGDKKKEQIRARIEFSNHRTEVQIFRLNRDDIRDKYNRDEQGKETDEIVKVGVFKRSGIINEDARSEFEELIASIRTFLS